MPTSTIYSLVLTLSVAPMWLITHHLIRFRPHISSLFGLISTYLFGYFIVTMASQNVSIPIFKSTSTNPAYKKRTASSVPQ